MNARWDENLDQAYERFRQNHEALRDALLAALPTNTNREKRLGAADRLRQFMGGVIMEKRMTKLAVAAALLLAVLLGLHYLGGSPVGTTVAWAEVLQNMDAAQTVTFTVERDATNPEGEHSWSKGTAQIKEPFRRLEESGGCRYRDGPVHEESNICIMDLSRNRRFVHLLPKVKWAYYAPDHGAHDTLLTYDGLKQDFRDGTEEYLGEEIIDGRKVVCFQVTKDDNVIKVWADSKTALPVRIERTANDGHEKTVLSNIAFDVELADETFDMTIPDDYVVANLGTEEITIPFELTEHFLLESLRQQAVALGGRFPILFFMGGRPDAREEGRAQQKTAAPTETFGIANLGAEYMKRLPNESRCQYLGEGARLGDAGAVVFWYQRSDAPTCRVIYGDLNVRDVAPEDLPQAPWPPAELNFRE